MNVNFDDYRRIGIGERFYEGDVIKITDTTANPVPSNWIGTGMLVHEDDTAEFWRPLDEEPTGIELIFTPKPEPKPMRTLNVPESQPKAETPKARTNDDGKPPMAYLPWEALREMALVQAYGQQKYGDFWNYRKGLEVGRNVSCALRHITEWMDGKDNDQESGRSHLAHAITRLAFVLQNIKDGTAIDDRYRKAEQ